SAKKIANIPGVRAKFPVKIEPGILRFESGNLTDLTGSLGERPGSFCSKREISSARKPEEVAAASNRTTQSNDGPRGIREAALAALAGQVLPAHPIVGMVSGSQAAAHCRS